MATVQGAGAVQNDGSFVYSWTGVTPGNQGSPAGVGQYAGADGGLTVSIGGTGGTSPACQIEGSADGITWFNYSGSLTTAPPNFFAQSSPVPRFIRPNVTAGTGGTSLNFSVTVNRRA